MDILLELTLGVNLLKRKSIFPSWAWHARIAPCGVVRSLQCPSLYRRCTLPFDALRHKHNLVSPKMDILFKFICRQVFIMYNLRFHCEIRTLLHLHSSFRNRNKQKDIKAELLQAISWDFSYDVAWITMRRQVLGLYQVISSITISSYEK